MDPVEKILAIEEIKTLKARYCRFVDLQMLDELRSVFTDDAVVHYTSVRDEPYNLEDALVMIGASFQGAMLMHHAFLPEIEVLSSTTAKGVWAMQGRIYTLGEGAPEHTAKTMQGHGHYYEDYARQDGAWRIRRMKLVFQRRNYENYVQARL